MAARKVSPQMFEATARHHDKAAHYFKLAGRHEDAAQAEQAARAARESAKVAGHGMTVTDVAQTLTSYGYGVDDWQATGPDDREGWIAGEAHRILVEWDGFRFSRSGTFWSMTPTFEGLLEALRKDGLR